MKPLLSLSRMWNTFFTSSALFFFRPTIWKNFLWSKESAAVGGKEEVKEGQGGALGKIRETDVIAFIKRHPHGCGEQEGRGSSNREGCSAQGRTFLFPPHTHTKEPHGDCWPPRELYFYEVFWVRARGAAHGQTMDARVDGKATLSHATYHCQKINSERTRFYQGHIMGGGGEDPEVLHRHRDPSQRLEVG